MPADDAHPDVRPDVRPDACRVRQLTDALRAITGEAASARSALCEHELLIRLDNILALARNALDDQATRQDSGLPDSSSSG